ncbi:MAG: DNA glycosylase [Clostridia bacterium]|nr:DNA glycosylase [Clostridia bacterium]
MDNHANNGIRLNVGERFDLAASCECGQAFRWKPTPEGYHGIVGNRAVTVRLSDGQLEISPCPQRDAEFWSNYFDLARDYDAIETAVMRHPVLSACLPGALGLHVFNQEPFETLISFIISSNNNIRRIAAIIEKLCALAGDDVDCHPDCHAFPTPEAIARLPLEELYGIGLGYRAPYVQSSAQAVADGFDLEALRGIPLNEARAALQQLSGVGPKVADCVLLFSLGHADAFPVDVWIDRAMRALFFDCNSSVTRRQIMDAASSLGAYSGIIQQYIFHYARTNAMGKPTRK